MTGQKDRYSTTEKLWQLDDEQLTTPAHDELVITLLNKEYCRKLFPDIEISKILSEEPIKTNTGFIVGYWDVIVLGIVHETDNSGKPFYYPKTIYIECKPKVDSFGKVLRQINTYKNYIWQDQRGSVYLFTPDLRFKDAFESQNIKVISP